MSIILGIDQRILHLYQLICDVLNRKPEWLCQQIAVLLAIVGISSLLAYKQPTFIMWFYFITVIIMAAVWYYQARNLPFLLKQENPMWRIFWVIGTVANLVTFEFVSPIIMDFLAASYLYFAACDDPPPRKRKEAKQLAHNF